MEAKISAIQTVKDTENEENQPLFASQTAAGFGVPGDDTIDDSLNLHEYMVSNPTATFFVRVTGDSMEGAKIFDGDVLVIDRSLNPKHGSIVVAAVAGELLVKRLQQSSKGTFLVSENLGYDPISLDESEECYIWGVVCGTARKLT